MSKPKLLRISEKSRQHLQALNAEVQRAQNAFNAGLVATQHALELPDGCNIDLDSGAITYPATGEAKSA